MSPDGGARHGEPLDERVALRADVRTPVVLGAEQARCIVFFHEREGAVAELAVVAGERPQPARSERAGLHHERGGGGQGAEGVGIRDTEDRAGRCGVGAAPGGHVRRVVHDRAHRAGRHGDVIERGRVLVQRGDGGGGPLVHGDVVRVPVETILTKGDHNVGCGPSDDRSNVRLELPGLSPGQHAVRMVEDGDLRDAEDAGGVPELGLADVGPGRRPRVGVLAVFAVCDREQRHAHAEGGAPRQQPAAGERLVVRVGEHRQQRVRASSCLLPLVSCLLGHSRLRPSAPRGGAGTELGRNPRPSEFGARAPSGGGPGCRAGAGNREKVKFRPNFTYFTSFTARFPD